MNTPRDSGLENTCSTMTYTSTGALGGDGVKLPAVAGDDSF
jgi:hypothetical protein